jgi:molecular chaperone DnaJ
MLDADYYELLQVERGADERTIKTAYRKLAMECHPDRNPGCKVSEEKFKAISQAYECLKDPQKRAAYDRFGHAAFKNGGMGGAQDFGSFSDIFENIFGEFMNGQQADRRSNMLRGSDLRYDLEITLDDAYHGKEFELRVDTSASCEPCQGRGAKPGTGTRACTICGGRGQVRASQGFFVVERTCPTCRGAGEVISDPVRPLPRRGPGREAEVASRQHPGRGGRRHAHPPFRRRRGRRSRRTAGRSLHLHPSRPPLGLPARRDDALRPLPGELHDGGARRNHRGSGARQADSPDQDPGGHPVGQAASRARRRMTVLNGRGNGDMVIQVEVETPTRLSSRQKEILEEFRKTETGEECPASTGFFSKLKSMLG